MPNRQKDSKLGIAFNLSFADDSQILTALNTGFSGFGVNIDYQNLERHSVTSEGVVDLIIADEFTKAGYAELISHFRKWEKLKNCNYLSAEFVKYQVLNNDPKQKPIILKGGDNIFNSSFSKKELQIKDPLHPENISDDKLTSLFYELDSIITDFIREPLKLINVKPRELEQIMAEIYSIHGLEVELLAGPKDHGIDIKATARVPIDMPRDLAQHFKIGIQVKRYKKTNKITESQLRDFYGSLMADRYDHGHFITTSSLTASAKKYVAERRRIGDRITIIEGDDILELLISYCKQSWIAFWK